MILKPSATFGRCHQSAAEPDDLPLAPRLYLQIVEAWKKLFLVGFATIILRDTMYQLLIAFMVTLVHMLFMAIYRPYRAIGNGL